MEPTRRLNLLDVLILIAGAAVGMWLSRQQLRRYEEMSPVGPVTRVIIILIAVIWTWSLTLLVLRLRRPRPEWSALRRQPGFVASVGVIVGGLLATFDAISYLAMAPVRMAWIFWLNAINQFERVGLAILAAWLTMAVSGGWAPERGAIDRFGRALGVFWIASVFALPIVYAWTS